VSKFKVLSLLVVVLVLTTIVTVEIFAEQTDSKSEIAVRKLESQTVLYTIYRGEYQKIGQAIGGLYAQAMKNKIWPRGSLSCVYLNNPQYVSGEHCLVEIRIPVGQEAIKLAGTLGEMTDVKELKAMEIAIMTKPAGQMNYSSLYNSLHIWIARNGYRAADNTCEIFAANAGSMDYAQMKSEIMIPIVKVSPED
jgi:effector-binding domain-containing protein